MVSIVLASDLHRSDLQLSIQGENSPDIIRVLAVPSNNNYVDKYMLFCTRTTL